MESQYLASSEYIHTMPMSVTQLVLSHKSMPITAINRQLCLTTAKVQTQQRIAILHLQYHKVFRITFREFADWSLVQHKSVVLGGHQLQTRVAVVALRQWLIPRPAISTEAMLRLLAPRSIKAISTHTPSTKTYMPLTL